MSEPLPQQKVDYGRDAPYAVRNLALAALGCAVASVLIPPAVRLGAVTLVLRPMFRVTGVVLAIEVVLFLHYWFRGKMRHRDFILSLHGWRGDEQVLDVGCGRGLLLVGAAKRLQRGRAIGIDVWSKEDLSSNSLEATESNLRLEHVVERCQLVTSGAQSMPFQDESFEVIVSNLCLHNIYDRHTRQQAVDEIARVLRPGGVALLSDYKLTGEYAARLAWRGLEVKRRWGSLLHCFPPMRVVIARKPVGDPQHRPPAAFTPSEADG